MEIVDFCISCSYFTFRGKFYQQIDGTAMGNPLSPIIADYVMETLLDTVTRQHNATFPVLRKYVDDLVLALPAESVDDVRQLFNQYHGKIQFTVEIEMDGKLPFLDLLLVRQPDQSVRTEWYQKPISSGRFLNYFSAHNLRMKINTANNFIKRVKTFTTNSPLEKAKSVIHEHLRMNNYPKTLINRLINKSFETIHPRDTQLETSEKQYRSIVNIDGLTTNIVKTLKKDYPHVVISTTQPLVVRDILPKVKDAVLPNDLSIVIYCIPCNGKLNDETTCPSCYVGQTKNMLKTRISNHKSNVNCALKLLSEGDDLNDQGKKG